MLEHGNPDGMSGDEQQDQQPVGKQAKEKWQRRHSEPRQLSFRLDQRRADILQHPELVCRRIGRRPFLLRVTRKLGAIFGQNG